MQIPGYTIIEEIGKGGMSTVYRGVQESLQREVALKVLSAELTGDREYCEQLVTEGKTIARLVHPQIVTIYDLGRHEDYYYLAMEYVAGGSLRKLLDKSPPDQTRALKIFAEIAEILAFAHSQGIVHMDIKPRNILLRSNGDLVLTDFGISRDITLGDDETTPEYFHASPKYMSPEQIRGKNLDSRSDIYSLGVILYEMLAGEVPYRGDSAVEIARQHIHSPIPVCPDVSKTVQQLLDRLLAKDPADRFSDLEQALQALEWIEGKRPDDVLSGDTDRLSRVELLQELDDDEDIMNIELSDTGETTVAISSAFVSLSYDDEPVEEYIERDQVVELRQPTWTDEDEVVLPDLTDIDFKPIPGKAETNLWLRVFFPAAAAVVAVYIGVVSLLPEPMVDPVPVSSSIPQSVENFPLSDSVAVKEESSAIVEVPVSAESIASAPPGDTPQPTVASVLDKESVRPMADDAPPIQVAMAEIPEPDNAIDAATEIEAREPTEPAIDEPIALEDTVDDAETTLAVIDAEVLPPISAVDVSAPATLDSNSGIEQQALQEIAIEELPLAATEPVPSDTAAARLAQNTASPGTLGTDPDEVSAPQAASLPEAEFIAPPERSLADASGRDKGVAVERGRLVIDPALENMLRDFAQRVDRLGDGRVRVVLDDYGFYRENSAQLDRYAMDTLDRLGFVFRNHTGFAINIVDRTPQNGSLSVRNLSWNRARSASDYLIARGIEESKVQYRGNSIDDTTTVMSGIEIMLEPRATVALPGDS